MINVESVFISKAGLCLEQDMFEWFKEAILTEIIAAKVSIIPVLSVM